MVNPLIRPYFLGGWWHWGGPLRLPWLLAGGRNFGKFVRRPCVVTYLIHHESDEKARRMLSWQTRTRWWFQFFFMFIPIFGEMIPNLTNMFQRGWNHQLEKNTPWTLTAGSPKIAPKLKSGKSSEPNPSCVFGVPKAVGLRLFFNDHPKPPPPKFVDFLTTKFVDFLLVV